MTVDQNLRLRHAKKRPWLRRPKRAAEIANTLVQACAPHGKVGTCMVPNSATDNTVSDREMQKIATDRQVSRSLVAAGVITQKELDAAIALRKERGGTLVDCLISLGHLSAETLVEFFVSSAGKTEVDPSHLDIDPGLLGLLDRTTAHNLGVVPMDRTAGTLLLGSASPLDEAALTALEKATGLTPRIVICDRNNIETALNTHYGLRSGDSPSASIEVAPPLDPQRLETGTKLGHIAHLIRQVGSLPALPETVSRVREIMEDPASAVNEVVGVLTLDPPVAAKVLSVANSAAYGFPNRINDLTLAVSLLGLHETYGIVLSVAVADLANKLKHFDYKAFWLESMCSAAAARIVAKAAGLRRLSGVFSAGLLHDIGRVVLVELQPNYADLMPEPLWGRALVAEESRVIGLSHTEAGYSLAQYWNLPSEIAEPIRFHHTPELATTAKQYVAIVSLANVMACAPGGSLEESQGLFADYGAALEELRLDAEMTEAMLDEFLGIRSTALNEKPQDE